MYGGLECDPKSGLGDEAVTALCIKYDDDAAADDDDDDDDCDDSNNKSRYHTVTDYVDQSYVDVFDNNC
ncbi:hypothetical protein N9L68_00025 [bacterium]|nr:hypothetical protein [bacterium]